MKSCYLSFKTRFLLNTNLPIFIVKKSMFRTAAKIPECNMCMRPEHQRPECHIHKCTPMYLFIKEPVWHRRERQEQQQTGAYTYAGEALIAWGWAWYQELFRSRVNVICRSYCKLRRIALIAFRRQGEGWGSAILLSLKKVFFIHSQLEVIQNEWRRSYEGRDYGHARAWRPNHWWGRSLVDFVYISAEIGRGVM